jgi:uncharacterized protein YcgI (DUF1989 family)
MTGSSEVMTVPARRGRAQRLAKGQAIKIINTHGTQVCDTWAFSAEDLHEFMSMEHCAPPSPRSSRARATTFTPTGAGQSCSSRRTPRLAFTIP